MRFLPCRSALGWLGSQGPYSALGGKKIEARDKVLRRMVDIRPGFRRLEHAVADRQRYV
jgi:hypothetical protein